MTNINKSDWGYVPTDPDPDFDANHNKRVVEETIKKNEVIRARRERESNSKVGERAQALASYVKHVAKTKQNVTVEDYFGKQYLAYLRGQQIVERLKHAKTQEQSKKKGI
jgi:hypothetical protein